MLITLKFSATVQKALSSGLIRSSSISLHGSVAGSVLQEVKMNRKKLSGQETFPAYMARGYRSASRRNCRAFKAESHRTYRKRQRSHARRRASRSQQNQFFGKSEVNPAVLSAYIVTGIILLAAVLLRIFAIPKFKLIPGKFQSLLEMPVEFFSGMAKTNSPHKKRLCRSLHFQCGDLHISQHFVRVARHSGRHDTRRINSTSRTNRRH